MTSRSDAGTDPRVFVYRPLRNGRDLLRWAKREGFSGLVRLRDLHVTVGVAHHPIPRSSSLDDLLIVPAGGERTLLWFGEGLAAIAFTSPELSQRAKRLDGSVVDPERSYRPHVSFTLGGRPPAGEPAPYDGVLIFGPEAYQAEWP